MRRCLSSHSRAVERSAGHAGDRKLAARRSGTRLIRNSAVASKGQSCLQLKLTSAQVMRIHEAGSFCVSIDGSCSPWIFASNPRSR